MTVLDEWREAEPLPPAVEDAVKAMAIQPAAVLNLILPTPPGINAWWEPFSLRVRGRSVASLRLTKDATAYKALAERTLLAKGVDPVELEDVFDNLWLSVAVTSYLATPLERDADGPVKPLQDVLCALVGVDDARVRLSSGVVRLDPLDPRVAVTLRGYQVWDSSDDDGGPYYTVQTRHTAAGPRTEPRLVTPRRAPAPRATRIVNAL